MPTRSELPTTPTQPSAVELDFESDWADIRPRNREQTPPTPPQPAASGPRPSRPRPIPPQAAAQPAALRDEPALITALRLAASQLQNRFGRRGDRGSLLFAAIQAGLNPEDIADYLWVGTAREYRDYAEMIGYVPRSSPSTPLGRRLLGLLRAAQQPDRRADVASQLRVIADEIAPEEPEAQ